MKPWYATNARGLLALRLKGKNPVGPVVVSLIGQEFNELVLYVEPDMPPAKMDWRMLADLNVWVWASAQASLDWIIDTTWHIAQARPKSLVLRFEHGDHVHDVDCGAGLHRDGVADLKIPAEHQFWWTPANHSYTGIGHKITRALIARHPYGAML